MSTLVPEIDKADLELAVAELTTTDGKKPPIYLRPKLWWLATPDGVLELTHEQFKYVLALAAAEEGNHGTATCALAVLLAASDTKPEQ
jgi:hypothetical protein